MKLPFSLFLAIKYLKLKRNFLSSITVISIIGVVIGVAVLIIVLAIMTGFDEMWQNKILGFNSHLTINAPGIIENPEKVITAIDKIDGVSAAAGYIQGLVFLQNNHHIATPMLRGINIKAERKVSILPEHIKQGTFNIANEQIIIGSELAKTLSVEKGDNILIYSPETFIKGKNEITLPQEVTVAGIFELGMWEYDMGFVLIPIELARELYAVDNGVHAIQVMTTDPYRAPAIAEEIKQKTLSVNPNLYVRTWMQINKQLFDALQVEKNMMFFLLIFIVLVAAFGITNSLIIFVVQKTKEIGLIKALGFSSGKIMSIFLWQGCIQGIIGTGIGIILGFLVLHHRNNILQWLSVRLNMEMFPKQLYHLSEIPAIISLTDVLTVAGLSVLICTLAGILPAYRALRMHPAEALRYE
jgi:lipoprotein-releasing system permease protein